LVGSTNVGKGTSETHQSPVERALGKKRLVEFLEIGAASLFHLEYIIEREKIDCTYARSGYFLGAFTPVHFEKLRHKVDLINETETQTAEMIPRTRQHEVIATDYYHGGMAVTLAGGIHPALYHRGLLNACRRAGVTLCANSRVTRIGKGGNGLSAANAIDLGNIQFMANRQDDRMNASFVSRRRDDHDLIDLRHPGRDDCHNYR